MDLGIRGRTAIVCASSQGLGKACARALAEAGVAVVINGRNRTLLEQTAAEIRQATGSDVTPVLAPDATALGQIFWYTVEGDGRSTSRHARTTGHVGQHDCISNGRPQRPGKYGH